MAPGILPAGRLGDRVGRGISSTPKDILLLLGKQGQDSLQPPGLSGRGHIGYGRPVEVLYLGLAMEAEPGAYHHLKYAVPQVGQPRLDRARS